MRNFAQLTINHMFQYEISHTSNCIIYLYFRFSFILHVTILMTGELSTFVLLQRGLQYFVLSFFRPCLVLATFCFCCNIFFCCNHAMRVSCFRIIFRVICGAYSNAAIIVACNICCGICGYVRI